MHRSDFDPNKATIAELVSEVLILRADLATIGANFVLEAIHREWCNDYEQWTRIINKRTSRPWFIDRNDLEHDPTLDESGRWSTTLERPPQTLEEVEQQRGTWCAACGVHH
jgi:hypothetical protein